MTLVRSAVILLALAAPAKADVIVGVAGPMSGSFAAVGAEIRAGVEQAAADLGGIAGEPVKIVAVDDKCDPETGSAVANQLVGKGAAVVIGHACTGAALAAAKVYAGAGIVLISPAATNPRFTDERVGPAVFRMAPRSDLQARAIADHLLAAFRDKRVAFVHDGSVYGQGLVEATAKLYADDGGVPVTTEAFTPGEKSQITLAGRLQDAAVSAVVLGALPADAAVIAREVRGRGLSAELIGNESLGLAEFRALAGDAAEGVVFAVPRDLARAPGAGAVADSLRARGAEPGNAALAAYAALQVYAAAATEGGDGAAVAGRIAASTTPTAIGPVSFDGKGDMTEAGYALSIWRGLEPRPLE
ncbi:branched-chain amino acid ABC transporter substrate-binding protein [Oharaeibacter diazotrophicus]|uniref:Branched-chain amino acid transport system substrate-binding protein n=2 Tax=Oharaeibacter diazotrophicus TaxID=1920512 RepID=A0A4R6RLN6_9HYPH|nr:branched-chain amino acid ABC transporter substrate-binding protein [Oharaeibacter diazotrophicus]TDP87579.1 branched-chain amino acid transport system substrate-binding protein [Oharaeibacter diazotrophicus]BBE70477.1 leu/Ile/Val-binding protein precursor [Pleomorphomonas sp. SM30]GLS77221.1 branched chain amino acid ABC transporter substrate-binding protein [Oharaeibacter diazotrophicus]